MEIPEGHCNEVTLDEVLSILAQSTRVESRLRIKFGLKEGELALEMLRQARLAGDLGDRVHDFLSDEIANKAEYVLTSIDSICKGKLRRSIPSVGYGI